MKHPNMAGLLVETVKDRERTSQISKRVQQHEVDVFVRINEQKQIIYQTAIEIGLKFGLNRFPPIGPPKGNANVVVCPIFWDSPHTNMHKKRNQHSQHSTKRQEANKPTNQQINKPTDRQARKQANNPTESKMHTYQQFAIRSSDG